MTERRVSTEAMEEIDISWSPGALAELKALGFYRNEGSSEPSLEGINPVEGRPLIPKRSISALEVLSEAYEYPKPSSFSRGMRVDLPGATMLFLSGTASVDEKGLTAHVGDFDAQCLRTYRNLTQLLAAEKASWHDVVWTTCYLQDIDRDYEAFNKVRSMFLTAIGLDPLPASTGIQARLCRPELLVEIQVIAIVPRAASG
jgi:enamine deaminase RidA (YjgF/YER057c/UK114 family)